MIEVLNLTKDYGNFSLDVSFSLKNGETLALVGPSGCGKTTTLHLIAGLIDADGGKILVDGKDLSAFPPWKRKISIVFQDLALFPHLTVGGNVAYPLFIQGLPKTERCRAVEEALSKAHLAGYENRKIHTLSGGERQRTAIARALAASPSILLMDEPFSSLDAPLRRELRAEFAELRSKSEIPCIFVTHDREEAALIGNKIAFMARGRLAEIGYPSDVFLSPKTAAGAAFFGMGLVLPCSFIAKEAAVLIVDTRLGRLQIPAARASLKVFIPYDAFVLAGNGIPIDCRFCGVRFEGMRVVWVFQPHGAEELSISIAQDYSSATPEEGAEFRLYLRQDLARFVE